MPGSVGLRSQGSAEEVDNRRYMVAVGTDDDAGVNLKDFIQEACKRIDGQRKFGTSTWRTSYDRTEYPVTCTRAAEALARGEVDKAALFGGGGLEKPSRPTRCGVRRRRHRSLLDRKVCAVQQLPGALLG
jgi:hypothetical protein